MADDAPPATPKQNGNAHELVEYVLDPDNPDLPLLIRVVQQTYRHSVDAVNETRETRGLVIAQGGEIRLLARALGVDLEREAARAEAAARSVPPLVDRVSAAEAGVEQARRELESHSDLDKKMQTELAVTTAKIAALSEEDSQLKARQAEIDAEQKDLKRLQVAQDRAVRAAFVRGIPKLIKVLGAILVAIGPLVYLVQQSCAASHPAPSPPTTQGAPDAHAP